MGEDKKNIDNKIWMKMVYRYAIAIILGIAMFIYVVTSLGSTLSKLDIVMMLASGVLVFGGGFGIAISLFFHLWHRGE